MEKNIGKIAELILDAEISYLVTVSDGVATQTIITDDDTIDCEETLAEAMMDIWEEDGERFMASDGNDPEPSVIGKLFYLYDPEEDECFCPECIKKQEEELKLAQKN